MELVPQLLNFAYFAVGLGVGLLGIYLSVKFFTTQQREKFSEIASDLASIRATLSAMGEVTSSRAYAREERLF